MLGRLLSRPIAVCMPFAALCLLGGISLAFLPLDLFPDVSYPVLHVTLPLGGYGPQEIEQTLTKPVEASLASMNHLVRLKSYSREGKSEVQLEFEVETDMDFAMQDIRERLHQLMPQFPEDTRTPQITKYDPNASPIMVISLFGALDPVTLRSAAEEILKKKLSRVDGVAHIEVFGGRQLEVLIEPDLDRLRAYGLSILELTHLLKQNNLELSVGSLQHGQLRLPLRSQGEFRGLEDIRTLGVMRTPSGSLVYLQDLARVHFAGSEEETRSRYQGEPRVMVTIFRDYGAHIVEVTRALSQALDSLQKQLPFGLKTEIIYNQGTFIQDALSRLRDAGLIGGLLAVLVVMAFLAHLPSTLVIVLAIPISILATFGFMYLAGITLNLISLAGLTLGIGMLVDNAIVVVENIYRQRRSGLPAFPAANRGTVEVAQAITAATLVHLAVFFPIFFMQKRVRIFYQDLCYTVAVSLLVSLAVALVLVPVLAARLPLPRLPVRWLPYLTRWHRRHLAHVLRHKGWWLAASGVVLTLSLLGVRHLGFESSSRLDRGEFNLILQTPPGTILGQTDLLTHRAEQLLLAEPAVKDVSTRLQENHAQLQVRLKPARERHLSTAQLVEQVRPAIEALPFSHVSFHLERLGSTENTVNLEVHGSQPEDIITLALTARQHLSQLPQFRDWVIHLKNPVPEIEVRIDHARAAYLGLSAAEIAHSIRAAITGPLANRFREPEKEMDVRTRLPDQERGHLTFLQHLTVPKMSYPHKVQIPVWPALSLVTRMSSPEIHRLNRRPALELTAETRDLDLYRACQTLVPVLAALPRPPGGDIRLGQSYVELQENRREITYALILALVLMFMIMAGLFESFRAPLVIMSSVPLAAVGIVAALWLTGYAVSLAVYVGILTLVGIVVNNAIVLVDHVNMLRAQGRFYLRAVVQGTQDRLRPILMTSATAILGLLPMALEGQEGSQLWSPLAWTIIGGLLSATFFSLFIVPAVYTLIMPGPPRGAARRPAGEYLLKEEL